MVRCAWCGKKIGFFKWVKGFLDMSFAAVGGVFCENCKVKAASAVKEKMALTSREINKGLKRRSQVGGGGNGGGGNGGGGNGGGGNGA